MRLTPLGRAVVTIFFSLVLMAMCLMVIFAPPGWWLR